MCKEFYRPATDGRKRSYRVAGIHIAGFLGTVAGTLTVTQDDGTVLLNALPVAVGFNRIAIMLPNSGGSTVLLAGGAAGSLLV
jgi:ABC-type uncharacterized transport system permease subunit